MAVKTLLGMGTNAILLGKYYGIPHDASVVIMLFKCWCNNMSIGSLANMRNLTGGGEWDMVRFYAKQISCSCLKESCEVTKKSVPKRMGFCFHCKLEMEQAMLKVCSHCKLTQYSSWGCQIVGWQEARAQGFL